MTVWSIVPVHNRREFTLGAARQLLAQTLVPHVLIVDCGSTDGTRDALRALGPAVEVLNTDAGVYWGDAVTLALRALATRMNDEDDVLLINDDVTIEPDLVAALRACSHDAGRAAVGSLQFNSTQPEELLSLGMAVDWRRCQVHERALDPQARARALAERSLHTPSDLLSGRGTLYPVAALRAVGAHCHRLLPHYWADLELSDRVRRHGTQLLVAHGARVWSDPRPSGVGRSAPLTARLFSRRSRANIVDATVFFSVAGPPLLRPTAPARLLAPIAWHALRRRIAPSS